MFGVIATVEEIKGYLKGAKNAQFNPDDDPRIMDFAIEMTAKFQAECNRKFIPRRETRTYDHPDSSSFLGSSWGGASSPAGPVVRPLTGYNIADTLLLDDDLLEVITLTTNNGNTTVSASDYWLMTGGSYNYPPYDRIRLKPNGTQTVFAYEDTYQQANAVAGYWGYHEEWAQAWQQIDTVQDASLSSSATTLTVGGVNGEDELGRTPRFKTQQLCRFGTAEMFYIVGKNTDADQLKIKRGVNGTTAAVQANGTAIYVYRPMPELKHAMEVLATYAYRRKDSIGSPNEDNPIATPTGVVIMPSTLPGEVKAMLAKYKREPLR